MILKVSSNPEHSMILCSTLWGEVSDYRSPTALKGEVLKGSESPLWFELGFTLVLSGNVAVKSRPLVRM